MAKPTISPMAITQTSPPSISGITQSGQTLTAVGGEYSGGEGGSRFVWAYSENGGADWITSGANTVKNLTDADIGRVWKVTETVKAEGEDDVTFESAKTSVVLPADANLGTLTVSGPATGVVGEPQTFTAAVDGDADPKLISWAWEIQDGKGLKKDNVAWVDPTANPATVTFSEPAQAVRVVAYAGTEQTNVVDGPVVGFSTYDSQVLPPAPAPGADLEKKTDTVLEGVPFVGEILKIIPGSVQGGTEPYTVTYSWERGNQGTWHTIDGFAQDAYSPSVTDIGYSIRGVVTVTDAVGAELKLPSLGTTPVSEEPDQIDPETGMSGWAQYNVANLLYHYRQWKNRDLQIGMIDHQTFTVQGAGRLDDLGRAAATPTDGEILMVWNWLCFHWTGSIEVIGSGASGVFKLSCMGTGRFVPSGGAEAKVIGEPPFAPSIEEES